VRRTAVMLLLLLWCAIGGAALAVDRDTQSGKAAAGQSGGATVSKANVVSEEVTVHRPPGTGSFFGQFDRRATWTRQGRKMCLSPYGRGGQSHFRGGKAYSQVVRHLRRENWDSPRERLLSTY